MNLSFPRMASFQRKGLFLFAVLVGVCLAQQYWALSQSLKPVPKPVGLSKGFFVELRGDIRRPSLIHYGKALPVRQVIQDGGGLASNRSLSAVEAGQVLSEDAALEIGYFPEQGAFVRSGPLSNRARWILGRPLPLNQATAEDLDRLPGVGPGLARRIIAYREAQRGFSSLEELKQVEGLKEKTFDKIKDLLTLSDEKT